jgi:hypothetical protein
MTQTQTLVFTGREEKVYNRRDGGTGVLYIFTGNDGKKYKSFEDDVANAISLGEETTFQLEIGKPRPNPNGGMYAPDNFIRAIGAAPQYTANGGGGTTTSAAGDTNRYLQAFGHALKLMELGLIEFGDETPTLSDVSTIARAILASEQVEVTTAPAVATSEEVPN